VDDQQSAGFTALPLPSGADPDLARAIRTLRERQARSQEAVAHDAGVTVATLARIERAQTNPTWLTVRHIADALGVTLRDLADAIDGQDRQVGD
jgi:transcriptional regulator with XRE-family HTH domain